MFFEKLVFPPLSLSSPVFRPKRDFLSSLQEAHLNRAARRGVRWGGGGDVPARGAISIAQTEDFYCRFIFCFSASSFALFYEISFHFLRFTFERNWFSLMFLSLPPPSSCRCPRLSTHQTTDEAFFLSFFFRLLPEDNIIQNTFSSSFASSSLFFPSESLILRAIFHLAPHLLFRGICHTFKRAKIASSASPPAAETFFCLSQH